MKKSLFAALAALLLLTGCMEETAPPETVKAPDVVGLSKGEALDTLLKSNLSIVWEPADVGESTAPVNEWMAVGQTQAAGSEVEKYSKVTVQFERIKPGPGPTAEPEPSPSPEKTNDPEEPGIEPATAHGLAAEAEAAFRSSYGWPDEPYYSAITGFSGIDAPRLTVITSMANKFENEEEALALCRAVTSISHSVESEFTGVYVTAGEGGPSLAQCEVPIY